MGDFGYSLTENESRRAEAERAAIILAQNYPELRAVILFGSVARGQAGADSDIDLLVVTPPPLEGQEDWLDAIEEPESCPGVALSIKGEEYFLSRLAVGDAFLCGVRQEGVVLFERDGWASRVFAANQSPTAKQVALQVQEQLERLNYVESIIRGEDDGWRDIGDFCAEKLFITGRAVCMLYLLLDGKPVYGRKEAFLEMSLRHPELASAVQSIARLEPSWAWAKGRSEEEPELVGRTALLAALEGIQSVGISAIAAAEREEVGVELS